VETLALYLELFCLDDTIHFRKRMSLGQPSCELKANSRGTCSAKRLTGAASNGGGLSGENGRAHSAGVWVQRHPQ
jgi:hypothetical protein